ncbi:MAG: PAS domain S-box protein [Nitrospirota bacterium]|nr:PAS domain S-box protein [Nitrospirota bacterium]
MLTSDDHTRVPEAFRSINLTRYQWTVAALWTALIVLLLTLDTREVTRNLFDQARFEAREALIKDVAYREWLASHGGAYVPVTDTTPPNPYLAHVPERDITTPSGRRLTLVNPSYMMRQVHERGKDLYGQRGHVTSLKPVRPGNAPDAWETLALQKIAQGEAEYSSVVELDGKPHLRLMRPLLTEQDCLKCHAKQGYRVGDIRGGISGSIPLESHLAAISFHTRSMAAGYGTVWALGLLGLGFIGRRLRKNMRDRDAAEQALLESEQRFRGAFENAAVCGAIVDLTGRFIKVNRLLCETLGYTEAELLTRTFSDITHPDDVPIGIGYLQRMIAGDLEFASFEKRFVKKDGGIVHFIISPAIIRDAAGAPHHFIGLYQDITERKRAEQERERLTVAIEQAGETVVVTDAQGTIQYVNPMFETVTGYTRAEAIGRNPRLLKSGRQDDAFYRVLWDTITSGRTWEGRIVNRKKDGTLYTENATISPVHDAAGRIVNYVAVKRDITEHLRMADERAQLEEQLRHAQKMEAVGTLAGGIAHDFNNILNVIMGYSSLMLEKLDAGRPEKEQLHEVLAAAERAESITRRLLTFSRKQVVDVRTVNLNEIVRGLRKLIGRLIKENIDLRLELADRPLPVMVDAGQIEQVLMNLATNAKDAMPNGGSLTIATRLTEMEAKQVAAYGYGKPGRYALLTVADTGHGIDAETQKKIFEPFFTTKPVGEGTGLGLAISYGIIKQHNGYLTVYSEPGHGSVFNVYLPLLEEEAVRANRAEAPAAVLVGTETILLAEDDAALRSMTRTILESFGYQVVPAQDGAEAIARFSEQRDAIQLVILDVIMPKKSGKEAYEEIRKARPGIKALFVSGYTMDTLTSKGLAETGADFVQKPIAPRDLLHKVREILDR